MLNVFDSDLVANFVLFASFCSMALGTVMIAAGMTMKRRLARRRA
jgi:hypothetical protein